MHELGITQEIIALAVEASGGAKVARIVVEIGKLTAILPDAVRFCFELCREGTAVAEADLEIIEIDGRARCRQCHADLVFEQPFGLCRCGSGDLEWFSGDELKVKALEVI